MGTGIEWTDETWNPTTGCSLVSEGCRNCYAMRMARRLDGQGKGYDGTTEPGPSGPRWTGKVNLHPDRLEIPLRWRKPRKVFVDSMSDLFHPDVPFEFVDQVFAVMALAPQHTFQVLTKRPDRMADYLNETAEHWAETNRQRSREWFVNDAAIHLTRGESGFFDWPLPNVWLGVSVEDQPAADERIPHLLKIPAAVRFLSCEPLLSGLDLGELKDVEVVAGRSAGIDWLIAGGESGPGARPTHPAWARSLRDQCVGAGVPFLFKQWGAWVETPHEEEVRPMSEMPPERPRHCYVEPGGHVITRRQQARPDTPYRWMTRMGKKAAGRLLDGEEWNQVPEVSP